MLCFTCSVNLWVFFGYGLNCRAMTEQKTRYAKPCHAGVTVCNFAPLSLHNTAKLACDVTLLAPLSHLSFSLLHHMFLTTKTCQYYSYGSNFFAWRKNEIFL